MRLQGNKTVQAPVGGLQMMSANTPNTAILYRFQRYFFIIIYHLFNFQRTLRRKTMYYCDDPRENLSIPVYSCRGIVERFVGNEW